MLGENRQPTCKDQYRSHPSVGPAAENGNRFFTGKNRRRRGGRNAGVVGDSYTRPKDHVHSPSGFRLPPPSSKRRETWNPSICAKSATQFSNWKSWPILGHRRPAPCDRHYRGMVTGGSGVFPERNAKAFVCCRRARTRRYSQSGDRGRLHSPVKKFLVRAEKVSVSPQAAGRVPYEPVFRSSSSRTSSSRPRKLAARAWPTRAAAWEGAP